MRKSTGCSRWRGSSRSRSPAARRRSWASARSRRPSKALARAGIEIGAIDVVELNEAFASQALACARELGIRDETLNLDGGAIALGHPLGATGARITGKAASLLARDGGRYALATPVHRRRPGHRHDPGARVMADPIRKVGVIGAGMMGAGIAAQVANAGVPVVLLDIVPKGANNRNALAEGAVAKLLKTEPAPFMYDGAARLIETGNIEDDLGKLADCDWIVEAVRRAARHQAGAVPQAGGGAPAGQRDQFQHLDHPAEGADRGHERGVPRATS